MQKDLKLSYKKTSRLELNLNNIDYNMRRET